MDNACRVIDNSKNHITDDQIRNINTDELRLGQQQREPGSIIRTLAR